MTPNINLMPKLEKKDASSNVIYLLLAIFALVGISALTWMFLSANSKIDELTVEQTALQATKDKRTAELEALQSLNSGSLQESLAFVERVSYPVTPLIDETQNLLPENTYLRDYAFSESTVTATMDFETLNSVSEYVSNLEGSEYFMDVQVGTVNNFELAPEGSTDTGDTINFDEVPRYSVDVTLMIDVMYTAAGGGQ